MRREELKHRTIRIMESATRCGGAVSFASLRTSSCFYWCWPAIKQLSVVHLLLYSTKFIHFSRVSTGSGIVETGECTLREVQGCTNRTKCYGSVSSPICSSSSSISRLHFPPSSTLTKDWLFLHFVTLRTLYTSYKHQTDLPCLALLTRLAYYQSTSLITPLMACKSVQPQMILCVGQFCCFVLKQANCTYRYLFNAYVRVYVKITPMMTITMT